MSVVLGRIERNVSEAKAVVTELNRTHSPLLVQLPRRESLERIAEPRPHDGNPAERSIGERAADLAAAVRSMSTDKAERAELAPIGC